MIISKNHDSIFWIAVVRDSVAGIIALGSALVLWLRLRGARHWPTTYGKVEYGMTSDVEGWKSNLVYSYSVSGEYYSGVHALAARNENDADEKVRRWKGQSVMVRYSPRTPSISVMRLEDQSSLNGGALEDRSTG